MCGQVRLFRSLEIETHCSINEKMGNITSLVTWSKAVTNSIITPICVFIHLTSHAPSYFYKVGDIEVQPLEFDTGDSLYISLLYRSCLGISLSPFQGVKVLCISDGFVTSVFGSTRSIVYFHGNAVFHNIAFS